MGEVKNRSVRLDGENYAWLQALPGRSLNEAVERLRTARDGEDPFEKRDAIAELLELVRSLPDTTDFEEVIRRVMQEVKIGARPPGLIMPATPGPFEEAIPVEDNRPKNCRCRHCGKGFAGPGFLRICGECRATGHTLLPGECPRCNEGSAI